MHERLTLYRAVRQMGVSQEKASALWTFMDWILDLPEELDDRFTEAVWREEESSGMRYISRLEEPDEDRGKSLGLLMGEARGMQRSLMFLLAGNAISTTPPRSRPSGRASHARGQP